jgi:hypothetical protein
MRELASLVRKFGPIGSPITRCRGGAARAIAPPAHERLSAGVSGAVGASSTTRPAATTRHWRAKWLAGVGLAISTLLGLGPAASAVDGGYGPSGPGASGGFGGTFANVVLATTVGVGQADIWASFQGTEVEIEIPAHAFSGQTELVLVSPSEVSLKAPLALCAFGLSLFPNRTVGAPLTVRLRNSGISKTSRVDEMSPDHVWVSDKTALAENSEVTVVLRGADAFLVTRGV